MLFEMGLAICVYTVVFLVLGFAMDKSRER
jgi:hypothetical protein